MRSAPLISVALQVGAVGLGHFWGVVCRYPVPSPTAYLTCALFAGLLMLGGIFASLGDAPVKQAPHRTEVCIVSLAYSVGVVLCEPFLHLSDERVVWAVILQIPLFLIIGYLVRCEAWLSLAGVTLFVFISNVMLTTNANTYSTTSGFFFEWVY